MKKYIIFSLITLLLGVSSCHDRLDTVPISTLSPEVLFSDISGVRIATNGVYERLPNFYSQDFILMSDNGTHTSRNSNKTQIRNLFATYTFITSEPKILSVWEEAYKIIFRANTVIEEGDKVSFDNQNDERLKNRYIAEARFLRALMYFNLVQFFGDVPLSLNQSQENRARTEASLVYDAIIEDLKFAEENLYIAHWATDENIPSYNASDLGRPTVDTAKGLLAKVYLTRASHPLQETAFFQDAFDKAGEVITSGRYRLDTDYTRLNTLEGTDSQEWMFQVHFNNALGVGSNWGKAQNPRGAGQTNLNKGQGFVCPTKKFAESFKATDPRFVFNIRKGRLPKEGDALNSENKSTLEWYGFKYRFSSLQAGNLNTNMNAPILRFADVVLVHAEAAAEIGDEISARNSLNLIQQRARTQEGGDGIEPVDLDATTTGDDLKDFIFWERGRELCFEGHSKFDIIRAGVDKFLAEVKNQEESTNINNSSNTRIVNWSDNVQAHHILFPIPDTEVQSNPLITVNNPGY